MVLAQFSSLWFVPLFISSVFSYGMPEKTRQKILKPCLWTGVIGVLITIGFAILLDVKVI